MAGRSDAAAGACYWCDRPFRTRRTGGRAQRFCRMSCRRQFHAAARRWALDAIGSGVLTVGDIKNGFQRTRALSPLTSGAVPIPGGGVVAAPTPAGPGERDVSAPMPVAGLHALGLDTPVGFALL
jgi:hypothetical protein